MTPLREKMIRDMQIEGFAEKAQYAYLNLLHVLPDSFVKIRYYGILSNKNKSTKLKKCQHLLGAFKKKIMKKKMSFEELLMRIKGIDYRMCSYCDNGRLIRIKEIEKKIWAFINRDSCINYIKK